MDFMPKDQNTNGLLPTANHLESRKADLVLNADMQVTEEDSMERKMILNCIYANNLIQLQ